MSDQRQHLKTLILDVVQLCERTRALAESGRQDSEAAAPVREAVTSVRQAIERLAAHGELESLSPALPSLPETVGAEHPSEDWLFDEGESSGLGG